MSKDRQFRWYLVADVVHSGYAVWVILFISLSLTVGAFVISTHLIEQRIRDRFNYSAQQLQREIESHLEVYNQVLRNAAAFYYATDPPTREQFSTYVRNLELNRFWPGIQGVGLSVPISPQQKQAHIESVRAQGFPEYDIRPLGERDFYTSIVYLEPFDWRNRRAFGYDMYTNLLRRKAMARARSSGELATTGKITLVQETEEDTQSGFLIYLPVYSTSPPPSTKSEREASFSGWVYSPFRTGDLMLGITKGEAYSIDFEIYDGENSDRENLLFDSNRVHDVRRVEESGALRWRNTFMFNGQPWTLYFTPGSEFTQSIDGREIPKFVVLGGIIIDVLLFYVLLSMRHMKHRVEAIAEQRNKELISAKYELETQKNFADAIIDSLPNVLFVKKVIGGEVVRLNHHARRLFETNDHSTMALFDRFQQQFNSQVRLTGSEFSASFISKLEVETLEGLRYFNIHQVPIKNVNGITEFMVVICNDITDRLDSERRFTLLFDSAPSGLMLVDRSQKISLVNRSLSDMFGYAAEELMGKPVNILIPPEAHGRHRDHVQKYLLNAGPKRLGSRSDIKGLTRDGSILVLDVALQPLRYEEQGEVLVSVTDITERHRLIQQLEKANRYKSEFLASMSHELRTPLNSIIGFSERVLKSSNVTLGEREQDGLETVLRNAHHLLSLINDILDLSKVESGHMNVNLEPLDVRQLLDLQLQALAPWAKAKNLKFKVSLPVTPIPMVTDKNVLLRILNNLVSNAVKYTRKGSISVSVNVTFEVSWGQTLTLQVTDTGIGITAKDQEKLFNEFVRTNEAREKNIEGTGLGLAITSRLVSVLGGRIEVESEHGVGSVFRVLLPMRRRSAELSPPENNQ